MGAPDPRPLVPVLAGPTAVGKTAVAVELGRLLPITVISADARQVYRGLDIGTAKPDAALRAELPHRGIDVAELGERYSAGRFARDAVRWLAEAAAEGRQALVVGGTGLYIRALTAGLFREPSLDPARRDGLRAWAEAMPAAVMAQWASRLDPAFRGGGRQRSARTVEMSLLTGRPLSWWQREARDAGVMRPWYILLTLPREALHRRIAARVDTMLAAGLVAEVRGILARGVPPDAPGLDGVGYREVVAMLAGRLRPEDLRDAIVRATRQYAKRQETWFRHQLRDDGAATGDAWVLDGTAAPSHLAERIAERWAAATRPPSPVPRSA